MLCGSATKAYKKVHPDVSMSTASSGGRRLMLNKKVRAEINERSKQITMNSIMGLEECMELLSRIANGEVQDQFGLDAALKDRISALKELVKIQQDMQATKTDNNLTIKLLR